jgi:hypothetical protein
MNKLHDGMKDIGLNADPMHRIKITLKLTGKSSIKVSFQEQRQKAPRKQHLSEQ